MGSAGIYLESDYSEECYTDRWYNFLPYVTVATVVFSVGIPAGFLFLVHKYKDRRNASSSSAALGWMCKLSALCMCDSLRIVVTCCLYGLTMQTCMTFADEPFRRGKEWFLGARF